MADDFLRIALVGNPNAGKTTLFNALTGLRQKTGNFPGVTVDKFEGLLTIGEKKFSLIDLPGTYSIYPKSEDEKVVLSTLLGVYRSLKPDRLILVLDSSTLKRSLLLLSQVADLDIPLAVAVTMNDIAEQKNEKVDLLYLERSFKVPFFSVNPRKGEGIEALLKCVYHDEFKLAKSNFGLESVVTRDFLDEAKKVSGLKNDYQALLLAHSVEEGNVKDPFRLSQINQKHKFVSRNCQARETLQRYFFINEVVEKAIVPLVGVKKTKFTDRLDEILTHRIYGYMVFLFILFLVFQSIFALATYPMNWIEHLISNIQRFCQPILGGGLFADLITEGVLAGIGGVLMFVPQITFLFFFISLLEETGYMARVMFIMDKLMRVFGMSGKSIIPLVSGVACAVPAIMSARSIDNKNDRLLTIFVTPFISCSARIPVFTILISLVVPPSTFLGIFNWQGLVLMGCYFVGFLAAILTAFALKNRKLSKSNSYFILELPVYRTPSWKNVFTTIYHKVVTFVVDAGKIIVAISVVLWWLATFGPAEKMQQAKDEALLVSQQQGVDYEDVLKSKKLEASYAGIVGKVIEPVIAPMGFDWKIGIALLTSFAAREVFVGTMATIYSVNADGENYDTLSERMRQEKRSDTGAVLYDMPLCFSLLVFYILAMQCMSTLAVTYKETKSLKWPILQFVYMTGLAYLSATIVYQVLSN